MKQKRFQDGHLRLAEFESKVLVTCHQCAGKAVAKTDPENGKARLFCSHCGYSKEVSTAIPAAGLSGNWRIAARLYFGAPLWLQQSFKNDVFWAYNEDHLNYLEQYIAATLRERKDRTHFTLLEKLPLFYHQAKNRDALLKIIEKLRQKG